MVQFKIKNIDYTFKDYAIHINNKMACPICKSCIAFNGYLVERNTDKKEFLVFNTLNCRNYHYSGSGFYKLLLIEKNNKDFDIELINQFKQMIKDTDLKLLGIDYL